MEKRSLAHSHDMSGVLVERKHELSVRREGIVVEREDVVEAAAEDEGRSASSGTVHGTR